MKNCSGERVLTANEYVEIIEKRMAVLELYKTEEGGQGERM